MTPGARYNTVIDLYDTILKDAKPADQIAQSYFRARKFIGSKDRKFITETLYDLLRHHARLNWWAKRVGLKADGRGLVLLWLSVVNGKTEKDITTLFDGAGYAPETLSRFEREVIDRVQNADFMPDDMPESIRLECPDWAYKGLKAKFGNDIAQELEALQDEAPLDLRVNTLMADRDAVIKKLRSDDFDVQPTPYSPIGIRVTGRPPFSAHPLYQKGAFEVQDEGSQLLSQLCDVKPGEWVVDFCAGAGGKTLALAAQMNNKGRIWACDVEKNRLDNSRKRLRRAGVHCVELHLLRDEDDDWVRKHADKADCVLIDAPCTGVGTWRRQPFARWQNLGPSVKTLTAIQGKILQSASRLVKPGGRLVYATCSMLPEENQAQVDAFLKENLQFKAQPLRLPDALNDEKGLSSLQLTPAQNETDGFFVSLMKRI